MKTESSSYMLIFRETTPERYDAMTQAQRRKSLDTWNAWCDDLAAQGKMQHGHPLEPTGRLVSEVRSKRVVDGPFAEAKELVGGYFVVTAAGMDEATEMAEQCPLLQYGMTVEVRPVASGCHLARSLGWESMREPAAT